MFWKVFGFSFGILCLLMGIKASMQGVRLYTEPVETMQYGDLASFLLGMVFVIAGVVVLHFTFNKGRLN